MPWPSGSPCSSATIFNLFATNKIRITIMLVWSGQCSVWPSTPQLASISHQAVYFHHMGTIMCIFTVCRNSDIFIASCHSTHTCSPLLLEVSAHFHWIQQFYRPNLSIFKVPFIITTGSKDCAHSRCYTCMDLCTLSAMYMWTWWIHVGQQDLMDCQQSDTY